MSNTNTGGPAFPEVRIKSGDNYNPPTKLYYGGMTLRDYFAAKAMQALLTKQGPYGEDLGEPYSEDVQHVGDLARYAYAQADAMLKARKGGAA